MLVPPKFKKAPGVVAGGISSAPSTTSTFKPFEFNNSGTWVFHWQVYLVSTDSKSINQIIDDYLDNNQNNIVNFQINNRFLKDTVNFDMYTVNLSRTYKLSLSKRVILRKKLSILDKDFKSKPAPRF